MALKKSEMLLLLLMEECDETSQRASKAIRFTLDEIEPKEGQTQTNAQRIVYEFNDLVAIMELLKEEGLIDKVIDREAIELKKEKVKKWMAYSVQQKTLEEC